VQELSGMTYRSTSNRFIRSQRKDDILTQAV
jgi:hypothetical protein